MFPVHSQKKGVSRVLRLSRPYMEVEPSKEPLKVLNTRWGTFTIGFSRTLFKGSMARVPNTRKPRTLLAPFFLRVYVKDRMQKFINAHIFNNNTCNNNYKLQNFLSFSPRFLFFTTSIPSVSFLFFSCLVLSLPSFNT